MLHEPVNQPGKPDRETLLGSDKLESFGTKSTRGPICSVCSLPVYFVEPQVNLDGLLFHKSCAKCQVCGCQITLTNFVKLASSDRNVVLLCKTHYDSNKDLHGTTFMLGNMGSKKKFGVPSTFSATANISPSESTMTMITSTPTTEPPAPPPPPPASRPDVPETIFSPSRSSSSSSSSSSSASTTNNFAHPQPQQPQPDQTSKLKLSIVAAFTTAEGVRHSAYEGGTSFFMDSPHQQHYLDEFAAAAVSADDGGMQIIHELLTSTEVTMTKTEVRKKAEDTSSHAVEVVARRASVVGLPGSSSPTSTPSSSPPSSPSSSSPSSSPLINQTTSTKTANLATEVCLDSGANLTVIPPEEAAKLGLPLLNVLKPFPVEFGDGRGRELVSQYIDGGPILGKIYILKGVALPLASIHPFTNKGYDIMFSKNEARILEGTKVVARGKMNAERRLYFFDLKDLIALSFKAGANKTTATFSAKAPAPPPQTTPPKQQQAQPQQQAQRSQEPQPFPEHLKPQKARRK